MPNTWTSGTRARRAAMSAAPSVSPEASPATTPTRKRAAMPRASANETALGPADEIDQRRNLRLRLAELLQLQQRVAEQQVRSVQDAKRVADVAHLVR